MMRVLRTFAVLLMGCMGPGLALAQDSGSSYQVNLVVFEQPPQLAAGYHWAGNPGFPMGGIAPPQGASTGPMQGVVDRLNAARGYRVLINTAWQQPGWERDRSEPVHVASETRVDVTAADMANLQSSWHGDRVDAGVVGSGGGEDEDIPPETGSTAVPQAAGGRVPAVSGNVAVWRQRYLHAAVDLVFQDQRQGGTQPVRLKTSRRMRSGELHYLDHARFGVLVLVSQVSG